MTSIEEKEYDKKIIVSGTKFTCDDVDTTIPAPLPQKGGFAIIVVRLESINDYYGGRPL